MKRIEAMEKYLSLLSEMVPTWRLLNVRRESAVSRNDVRSKVMVWYVQLSFANKGLLGATDPRDFATNILESRNVKTEGHGGLKISSIKVLKVCLG